MNNTALVLIDIQQGFEDLDYWGGRRNNPSAEYMAGELLKIWRENGMPVFHVKHNSTNPKSPLVKGRKGNNIHPAVAPVHDEPVYEKEVNSAFIGTTLGDDLKKVSIKTLVIAGLTTDHCISTSVRMGANLGFDIILAEDATATFDKTGPDGKKYTAEIIQGVVMASLHEEFARIMTVKQIIHEIPVHPG